MKVMKHSCRRVGTKKNENISPSPLPLLPPPASGGEIRKGTIAALPSREGKWVGTPSREGKWVGTPSREGKWVGTPSREEVPSPLAGEG